VHLLERRLEAFHKSIEIGARGHEALGTEGLELRGRSIALLPARRNLSHAAFDATSLAVAVPLQQVRHDCR